MSYVPAKLREIFQTCRLRPENIADRGALSARRPKIGASVPSLPAGARRRRREPPRDASRAEARRFGRSPRPLPFRGKFRSHFLFGERAGEDRGAGMQGVRRPPRWTITMDRGLFPSKKQRREADPFPCRCIRRVCPRTSEIAGFARAADRAAFPGRRADRRTQRRRDGFERCRQPGRVRTRAFSRGSGSSERGAQVRFGESQTMRTAPLQMDRIGNLLQPALRQVAVLVGG